MWVVVPQLKLDRENKSWGMEETQRSPPKTIVMGDGRIHRSEGLGWWSQTFCWTRSGRSPTPTPGGHGRLVRRIVGEAGPRRATPGNGTDRNDAAAFDHERRCRGTVAATPPILIANCRSSPATTVEGSPIIRVTKIRPWTGPCASSGARATRVHRSRT
jgi:hypothetical protein